MLIRVGIRNAWMGISDDFKEICISLSRMDGSYAYQDGVNYLINMMNKIYTLNDKDRFVMYVSRFFGYSMLPMELHEDGWKEQCDTLQVILEMTESVMFNLIDGDLIFINHRTEKGYTDDYDYINIIQEINAYLCICYFFMGNIEQLNYRLKIVLYMTINNLNYLICHKGAEYLINMQKIITDEFYVKGMKYWMEPLGLLINELTSVEQAELMTNIYCDYLDYLVIKYKEQSSNKVVKTILRGEERHLDKFIGLLNDGQIDDEMYEQGYNKAEFALRVFRKYKTNISEMLNGYSQQ